MGTPRNIYRRLDTTNYVPNRAGNLGVAAEREAEEAARTGSALLASTLARLGLRPEQNERRRLTFEEQLALVEQGRARVVAKPDLRAADERTLAGVSSAWMAA
jgi:hypothetical protein